MKIRKTPEKLSLVGQSVTLIAVPEEEWVEETLVVTKDYEMKKRDGFERFLQGTVNGEFLEVPYDQVKQ